MQHLSELRDGRLGIGLCLIIAPEILQGRSFEELGSGGNRRLEGDAVYPAHVVRHKQRIDVGVGVKRRDMTPKPCGRRLVLAPDRNIFYDDVGNPRPRPPY